MNKKNNMWLLHLGAVTIPKEWYVYRGEAKQGEEIPEQRTNQYSIRGYDHNRAISRMKRAIYILRKRYGVELNRNCYNILLSKNLIPLVKEKRYMGFERFRFYFYEVTKGKFGNATRPKDYVREHYKNKTVKEISSAINKSEKYVRSTISDIKKGLIK